ncbi:hypothetical protein [Providencia sp. PROV236]|uniref:hypothetical protein n=1 Tax=Providencia sp. PROV236 TaxID=2936798 RepID=UPI0034E1A1D8
MKKCESNGNRYATQICEFLNARAERQFGRSGTRKGLFISSMVNIESGNSLGEQVIYRDGNKNCTILNYCPFCGGKLNSIDKLEDSDKRGVE